MSKISTKPFGSLVFFRFDMASSPLVCVKNEPLGHLRPPCTAFVWDYSNILRVILQIIFSFETELHDTSRRCFLLMFSVTDEFHLNL